MSDFLNNLAAKSLSLANAIQPRIPSPFEPQSALANQPARFSNHLSAELRAAWEEEHAVLGISDSSASTLEQSTRSNSITSSFKPSADAAAKEAEDRNAVYSHRVEPARARGSTDTVSSAPNAPLDLSRPPAPDASVVRRPAADRPTLPTNKSDLAPQSRDERERHITLVPDIRRMIDEQINPLEAQASSTTRADQVAANQPAPPFPARTITPAQVSHAPKLPVAHLHSPAPVASRSPEIKITIGRVDVRAVMPAPPVARAQPATRSAPTSLDEYLRERSGGRP